MGSLEASIQVAARRLAQELAQQLRSADVSELLALAEDRPAIHVAIGDAGQSGSKKPAPPRKRSESLAKARIAQAARELAAEYALKPREETMLHHVAYGALRAELAKLMKLSPNTMKLHIRALLAKVKAEHLGEVAARLLHRAASYE